MKRTIIQALAALLAAPLVLAGCSQEDLGSAGESRKVNMTVSVAKEGLTRSFLEENSDGNLDCRWQKNDKLIVAKTDGTKLGVLSIDPADDGKTSASFSGQFDIDGPDRQTLNFIYLGNATNAETVESPVHFYYANQRGTLQGLSDYDFFSRTAEVAISEGTATAGIIDMERRIAFGHFQLKDLPASTAGYDVTVSGSGLVTNATIKFDGTAPVFDGDNSTIATKADVNGDVFLTILPPADNTDLTFTVSVAGKTYTGHLDERANGWHANDYVGATLADGSFAGVPVAMTEKDDDTDRNEYGEPVNNPLAKWAKGNLYRKDGLANGILGEEGTDVADNGALYQWGRNYGYMDTKGIYTNSNTGFDPGDDYTNYVDAMGLMTYDWDNYDSRVDYYVYDPSGEVVSGTGCHLNKGYAWEDKPYNYSSVNDIKAHPDRYFMDARTTGGRTEDYWISSFGDGGSTWEQRAAKCGYEKTNPCPDGWRLPTEAEFRSIMPQTNLEGSRQSLTEILNAAGAQLRQYNGVRYVIRWLNFSGYIEIQSLVVDESFKESQISTITWESNPDVVKRRFQYTGHIDNLFGYHYYTSVYYARPYGRYRTVNAGVWTVNQGHDGVIYDYGMDYLMIGPATPNYGSSYGAYWVSDGQKAMKFSNRQSFEASSYIEIGTSGAAMGLAIRPVRDENAK